MLNSISLNDKTYDEMLMEAISQIPLYTDEWTNFNVSDPGITILQNLTSFNMLQQSYINEITDEARRKLLKMLGFTAEKNKSASVFLQYSGEEVFKLPQHHKLMVGELCFETKEEIELKPWGINAVYTEDEGQYNDITYLLDRNVPTAASIFGSKAKSDVSILVVIGGVPEDSRKLLLSVQVKDEAKRNEFNEDTKPPFGKVSWEIFTQDGWASVNAEDYTFGFLKSGVIILDLSNIKAVTYEDAPVTGYALRCILKDENYDILPKIQSMATNLFEVIQKDTKVASFLFNGKEKIRLTSEMAAYGNIFVYCKEEEKGPYRAYVRHGMQTKQGRYFTMEGLDTIVFSKEKFGFEPCDCIDSVRVVCYDDDMVLNRKLGTVFGYENQEIDVEVDGNILINEFCVIAKTRDKGGEEEYRFIEPDGTDEDNLCYKVLPEKWKIIITNAGLGEDCQLILCNCAVTAGKGGNIRDGNKFEPKFMRADFPNEIYLNPLKGENGTTYETWEELRLRFVADLKRPARAVTAYDYEEIVHQTPGLCIHKVKAVTDEINNLVKIAVKPYTEESFPLLSAEYVKQIDRWIEPRRMITTKVEIIQPRYIPINIQASVYVKSYFQNAYKQIEDMLKTELDYINSEHSFGETIRFNEVYEKLEAMDCVEFVYKLALIPNVRSGVEMKELDICLGSQCLCYLGRLDLEINSNIGQ